MTQPLAGMTVLDLSRLLPGPMCSLHLQDMGARVIKVEDTGAGDYTRSLGMPKGFTSPAFHILNRGKESISLDLTHPDGHQVLLKLVAEADILLESFRPGVMKKLGLSYERLQAVNPKLVMCSISGYGQTGPWAEKAGHDMNYCATAGILDQVGEANGAPVLSNFQIADLAGGSLSAAMAILAAVVGCLRHGHGSYLDISMTDCAFANNVIPLAAMNLMGKALPRGQDMLTGARPCYGVYRTADNQFMAVGALEQKFWQQVCEVLNKPEWLSRYHDMGTKADALRAEVAELFASQPQSHWRDVFAGTDCCVTPVLTPQQAFEHPQLLAREMVQVLTTTQGHKLRCPATPFTFQNSEQAVEKSVSTQPGPEQGAHTLSVLRSLNISDQQLHQWLDTGVIRQAGSSQQSEHKNNMETSV
ncbi:CaiB/BaiF CoA transferase family protein [Thalassolituus sp. LLYu03]|uniref:CaiB/BaiF CoA transferase family protein n=1 Tax=Thalassolituus sp. LLYu03 TaxID=3421656 RepID=UPI003D29E535